MRIAGFVKVRQEVVRGNLYRCLANLKATCDTGIICDDASTDGTAQVVLDFCTQNGWLFMRVHPDEQSFDRELEVKQRMMELLRTQIAEGMPAPDWVDWRDGDETWDAAGTKGLRAWLSDVASQHPEWKGVRAHYTQLWRNASWARTDDGFDEGFFLKLWRWSPDLSFDLRPGTHRSQFPTQIEYSKTPVAPFDVVHWGNYAKSLQFKAHQYIPGGVGGVDRHLAFGHDPSESLAAGIGYDQAKWSKPHPTYRRVAQETLPAPVPGEALCTDKGNPEPMPYTLDEIKRIRSMGGLKALPGWFTVVIPAFNRYATLPKALESLLAQRYDKWIALVLDDGSTDSTPELMAEWQEKDPRIFYCRYNENRGGVAANEIGMAMACEMTEYWSRCGSDDWWGPEKLAEDAAALAHHDAVFGPFTVFKYGRNDHICAGSWGPAQDASPSERLRRGEFLASWANVAVKTSVLRKVKEKWGDFVDARLRNQEDYLFNVRVAQLGIEWAWRPGDPQSAFWNCLEAVGAPASASASADADTTGRDTALTRRLIVEQKP